jgi:hypothetical protein
MFDHTDKTNPALDLNRLTCDAASKRHSHERAAKQKNHATPASRPKRLKSGAIALQMFQPNHVRAEIFARPFNDNSLSPSEASSTSTITSTIKNLQKKLR